MRVNQHHYLLKIATASPSAHSPSPPLLPALSLARDTRHAVARYVQKWVILIGLLLLPNLPLA